MARYSLLLVEIPKATATHIRFGTVLPSLVSNESEGGCQDIFDYSEDKTERKDSEGCTHNTSNDIMCSRFGNCQMQHPAFLLNTDECSLLRRLQSQHGKNRTGCRLV
uniref:Uncharacterized protein n=1 Tax=Clastoptera arizonana TaxID=38151 RepID=A0A1B6DE44_9HEMI